MDDTAMNFVFVHGAWHTAAHWNRVGQRLTEQGHRVIALDLPGSGLRAAYPPSYLRNDFAVLASEVSPLKEVRLADYVTAVVAEVERAARLGPVTLVGHSFGGVIPGLARSVTEIDRLLTVGAQYAWLGDYASGRRVALVMKWHVAMALLTACCGYFPGKRLGWLEDLPAGVAYEWTFRGPRFENSYPRHERSAVIDRIASFTAPILAIVVSDDEIGTAPAINRALDYYTGSVRKMVTLKPHDYCQQSMGHFNLFREERANDFWEETLAWLKDGQNAWLGYKR